MISVSTSGDTKKTEKFLEFLKTDRMFSSLPAYARRGVDALSRATPVETGRAAGSWKYEIVHSRGSHYIYWDNYNIEGGVNVAVILQYGHGTGTGGYVVGRDYINPAMKPIFDEVANVVWKEVENA